MPRRPVDRSVRRTHPAGAAAPGRRPGAAAGRADRPPAPDRRDARCREQPAPPGPGSGTAARSRQPPPVAAAGAGQDRARSRRHHPRVACLAGCRRPVGVDPGGRLDHRSHADRRAARARPPRPGAGSRPWWGSRRSTGTAVPSAGAVWSPVAVAACARSCSWPRSPRSASTRRSVPFTSVSPTPAVRRSLRSPPACASSW